MYMATIDSLCTKISSGGTPSRKKPEYYSESNDGHLWVKSKELLERSISDTEEKITDEGLKHSSAKYYPEGTVLLAMYGANVGQLGWLKKPATVNQAICAMVANPEKADFRYLFYALTQTRNGLINKAHGAAQQNLNSGLVREYEVPIHSLAQQKKIADVLSVYDFLIENNNRRIAILEEMAQSLYREWFVKFRYPGFENTKFIDSPLGKIPEGWEVKPFTDIAVVLSGGTPKTKVAEYWDGEIPFFAPKDASSDYYILNTEKKITELGLSKCASKLYPKDTVFITARGTVGKVVMPDDGMAMNQSCYALKGKDGITQHFLFLLTKNQVEYLKKNTGGATFDTIVTETFRRMHILDPSPDLVTDFSRIIEPLFDEILNLAKKNENLKKQRDILLPKLILGIIHCI